MPPFVGVAVKVTLLLAQVGFVPDVTAILTLAGKFGFTVTVTTLLGAAVQETPLRVLVTTLR